MSNHPIDLGEKFIYCFSGYYIGTYSCNFCSILAIHVKFVLKFIIWISRKFKTWVHSFDDICTYYNAIWHFRSIIMNVMEYDACNTICT